MEDEIKIDLVEFRGRVTRGMRIYTGLDYDPLEDTSIDTELYHYNMYFLHALKGKESWLQFKSSLEDVAYSTIEVRKAAEALHKIVQSIRAMNKMYTDKSGSSTVFLFNLMAKYPLMDSMVKILSKVEFGSMPPECTLYQVKKLVNTVKEYLPADVVRKLESKRDDMGKSNTPFCFSNFKFVSCTPWSPDMTGLSKLSNLDVYDTNLKYEEFVKLEGEEFEENMAGLSKLSNLDVYDTNLKYEEFVKLEGKEFEESESKLILVNK